MEGGKGEDKRKHRNYLVGLCYKLEEGVKETWNICHCFQLMMNSQK